MPGLTLDTGALIALEAHRLSMRKVFHTAVANGVRLTVPAVVVATSLMSSSAPSSAEPLEPATFELDEEERAAIDAAELSLDRGEGLDATESLCASC